MSTPLLEVQDVTRTYAMGGILSRRRFDAVAEVSFALEAGRPEIFTIVGESGSGKTTLARMILNLVPPTAGVVRFRGTDLATIRGRRDRLAFMRQVQPIFQNPFEAFNPLKRIDRYLFLTARHFTGARTTAEIEGQADRALRKVGLSLGEVKGRFPHELSGGQLQRIAVARALISEPSLIVADEPVSMVDASLRVSIVNLFRPCATSSECRSSTSPTTWRLPTTSAIAWSSCKRGGWSSAATRARCCPLPSTPTRSCSRARCSRPIRPAAARSPQPTCRAGMPASKRHERR